MPILSVKIRTQTISTQKKIQLDKKKKKKQKTIQNTKFKVRTYAGVTIKHCKVSAAFLLYTCTKV